MLQLLTDEQIKTLYLDWVNNFLTLERFAEYYQIDEALADRIIQKGRTL